MKKILLTALLGIILLSGCTDQRPLILCCNEYNTNLYRCNKTKCEPFETTTTTTIEEDYYNLNRSGNLTTTNPFEGKVCVDVPCEGQTRCNKVIVKETNETYYTNCYTNMVRCMRCFNESEVTIERGVTQ